MHRFTEVPGNPQQYLVFSNWMKKNFPDKSTFLDFSNSSMLYYFTDKVVPNYFDQIPHTAHNEYLQNRFIDELKNYDVPVVVFSNEPKIFWDNLDGIPNSLRHYRIAEYIYRNYKPAFVMDNRNIWVKINYPLNTNEKEYLATSANDTILKTPADNIKWIPYIWGTYDSNFKKGNIHSMESIFTVQNILKADKEAKFIFNPVVDKQTGNYFLFNARVLSGKQTAFLINYGDNNGLSGSVNFDLKNDTIFHDYLVRISSQYNWYSRNNSWLTLYPVGNDVEISKAEILKGD
jgi:hypothetical protein